MNGIQRTLLALSTFAALAAPVAPGFAQDNNSRDLQNAAMQRLNAIQAATGMRPQAATGTKPQAATASKAPAVDPLPSGDPCTAVSLAAVQRVLPGAKAGERSRRLESILQTTECEWKNSKGETLLVLHETYDSAKNAKEDTEGMAELYVGEKAGKNVRVETFPGLGVDNGAFVEAADASRSFKNSFGFVEVRKGRHNVTMGAPGFVFQDRAQALKGFEALGREASSRL